MSMLMDNLVPLLCPYFNDRCVLLVEIQYDMITDFFSLGSLFYNINTNSVEDLTGRGWYEFHLLLSFQEPLIYIVRIFTYVYFSSFLFKFQELKI